MSNADVFSRRLWASVLVSLVLTGCVTAQRGAETPPSDKTATAQRTLRQDIGVSPPVIARVPGVRIAIRSHCGVASVTVAGRLWLADPPLGRESHNPPPGWDDNETLGYFEVTSPGHGAFHGDGGQEALFRRAEPGAVDPQAGCE